MQFKSPDQIERDADKQIKVQKAKMKAYGQLTDIELERLKKEEEIQPRVDEIDKLKMNIQGKKTLQKQAWLYRLSANALSVISALMTIAGIAGTKNLLDIAGAFTGKTGIYAIATALLQLNVIILNKRSSEIKENHFADYKGVSKFKAIVIGISMIGNFLYMRAIMPNSSFYMIVSLAVAIALDFGSIWISNLATNVQYRNYTNDTTKADNKTRFDKLLYIINDFCFGWIDSQYEARVAGKNKNVQACISDEVNASKASKHSDCSKIPDGSFKGIDQELVA